MGPRLIAVLALLGAGGLALGEARPPTGGKATGSLIGMPAVVDPVVAQSFGEVTFTGLLFDTLYRLDAGGRVVPDLAVGPPSLSQDGRRARIALVKGAQFHDGHRMHPIDVVASLRRAQGAHVWATAPINLIGLDGETVVITFMRPVTVDELTALLAVPQLAVTSGGRSPGAHNVIGTGAFRLGKIDAATRTVELEAFPEHFAGRPYLDTLVLRWFEDGESEARAYEAGGAEISLHGAVAFQGNQPKFPTAALDGPATVLTYLGFGKAHPELLADVDVRRGVSLALSRAVLARTGGGERILPATLPESPDLGGTAAGNGDADAHVDQALTSLRKAAARRPELATALDRKAPLALELVVDRSRPDDFEVGGRVVAALYPLGLSVTLTRLSPVDFARRVAAGQCDLYIGQLVPPTTDRTHEYAAAFAAGGDSWAAGELAHAPLDAGAAQAAFSARLPILPLFHRAVRAHHRTILHGLWFDPLGRMGLADAFLFPDAVEPAAGVDPP